MKAEIISFIFNFGDFSKLLLLLEKILILLSLYLKNLK